MKSEIKLNSKHNTIPHFVQKQPPEVFYKKGVLRARFMRPEVNPNRFEISLRDKISLRCEVTSLSAFT